MKRFFITFALLLLMSTSLLAAQPLDPREQAGKLASAIAVPLYGYDLATVASIIEAMVKDTDAIRAVDILDSISEKVLFEAFKSDDNTIHSGEPIPETHKKELQLLIHSVVHEQEKIAELRLYFIPGGGGAVHLTGEERAWLAAHSKIVVGGETDWAPFDFVDETGKYAGIADDYLKVIGEKLGIEVEIITGPSWNELLSMIRRKEIDVLPAIYHSKKREDFVHFTTPYIQITEFIFSRSDNEAISSFSDLKDKTIVVVKGYTIEDFIRSNYPEFDLVTAPTIQDALKKLVTGEAEAFIGDIISTSYNIRELSLVGLKPIASVPFQGPSVHMAVRKDWPILRNLIDKTLKAIPEKEHNAIKNRWMAITEKKIEGKRSKVSLSPKEQAWLSAHPVIRVHNEWNWPPFNYNEDGEPTGLSIDYMNLLASRIGVKVKYISGEWGELLDQAFNKKLDVMLNIVKTPERQKYLLYTDSYAKNPNVIITREESSISDTQSLFGKKVAYSEGFFYDEVLKTTFPEIIRVPMKDTLETLKAIQFGKVDAALGELAVANYLIRENLLTGLAIKGTFDSGNPEIEKLNIAVRNDWPILATILDKALLAITLEEHRQLQSKWLGELQRTDDVDPALGLSEAEKRWLKQHPTIRLGDDFAWPPLIYKDDNDKFVGIASSYTESFSRKLGIDFLPQFGLNWEQVLEGIKSRKLDVLPAVVRTPEREAFMAFTKPYISFPIIVATRKDSPYIDGLSDLAGKRVGVVKGYTVQKQVTDGFPSLNVIPHETLAKGLVALAEGELDAFVGNLGVINHEMNRIGHDTLKIAAPTPYVFDLSFGVRKDWPELVDIIDKAITAMTDREKAAIKNTWMGITVQFGTQLSTILKWVIPVLFVILGIIAFVVIWNRRLGREISQRKQKEKLIVLSGKISQSLTTADSLKETLQSITDILVNELNVAFSRIWIVDETENKLKLQASSGLYTHIQGAHEIMPMGGETKIGRVVAEKRPQVSNSIQDSLYIKDKDWARDQGLTSFAGIPMIVEGRAVGAMVVFSREAIQEDVVNTILSVSDSIAVAIERNRAEEVLKESEDALREQAIQLRTIFQKSPIGILHVGKDGTVLDCNERHAELMGSTREKIIGMNLRKEIRNDEVRAAVLAPLPVSKTNLKENILLSAGEKP